MPPSLAARQGTSRRTCRVRGNARSARGGGKPPLPVTGGKPPLPLGVSVTALTRGKPPVSTWAGASPPLLAVRQGALRRARRVRGDALSARGGEQAAAPRGKGQAAAASWCERNGAWSISPLAGTVLPKAMASTMMPSQAFINVLVAGMSSVIKQYTPCMREPLLLPGFRLEVSVAQNAHGAFHRRAVEGGGLGASRAPLGRLPEGP